MRMFWVALVVLVAIAIRSENSMALKLGDAVGAVAMTNLDGHPRVMNYYPEHKGTVLVFLSGRCDATHAQIAKLNAVAALDENEEMVFVGICSNPAETGEELRTFCQRRGLMFPVYRDPDGQAAKQFGAKWTPEFFLLDNAGKLVYHGDLAAFARSRPHILASESRDGGVTWTPPVQTPLKCPDSGIVMIRLKSGRLLLAHNDNDGEDRATLALEQSDDEGRTWKDKKILEMEPNLAAGEYSYPCLIQASDGMIHITYTCRRYAVKHAAFDEGWLTHIERPN